MNPHSFRKHEHLRSPAEFRRVYDRRCTASDEILVVKGCRNDLAFSRVGFSVSRAFGTAVVRNRLRRLYREAFRLSKSLLPVGLDIVLIPRSKEVPALARLMESLQKSALNVQRKLGREEKH